MSERARVLALFKTRAQVKLQLAAAKGQVDPEPERCSGSAGQRPRPLSNGVSAVSPRCLPGDPWNRCRSKSTDEHVKTLVVTNVAMSP